MKEFKESKERYDRIEVPKELSDMVEKTIVEHEKTGTSERPKRVNPMIKWRWITAAASVFCLFIGLNTSQSFAMGMQEVPVVGLIARVLTIRSYQVHDEDGMHLEVEVPQIVAEDGKTDLETQETEVQEAVITDVNAEIQKLVDAHMEKAEMDFAEYKEAFFATGGTEEEWAERTMNADIRYEVTYQNEDRLSLVLYVSEDWVAAYEEEYYYNLDLKENRRLTLEDVLGSEYVELANESIIAQMEERMEQDETLVYWGIGEGEDSFEGFATVDDDTDFYINEAGNPVVVFEKYAVAPGFMGAQEFEISLP